MTPTSIHEDVGSIPGLTQQVKGFGVAVSCGVGFRHSLDLALLWLWCRSAAVAPIGPLAWEPPYAAGEALKKGRKKKRMYCHIDIGMDKENVVYIHNGILLIH